VNGPPRQDAEFTLAAAAATAGLCALFGANAVAIKVSLTGLGVFSAVVIRFTLATTAVAAWARITRRPFRLQPGQFRQMAVITALFATQISLFYLGLSKTQASRGALLVNLQPFFVLILAHVFLRGDRITTRRLAGLLIGFGGVLVMLGDPVAIASGLRTGDLIIMGATVLWSINAVYVKQVISRYQAFHMVLYPMLFSIPIFAIEAALWDPTPVKQVTTAVTVAMLYQGLVTAGFGFVVWNHLLKRYGAVTIHSFLFILPVTGVTFSGLILGEPITGRILLSMAMIMAGLFVVHIHRRKPLPPAPVSRSL